MEHEDDTDLQPARKVVLTDSASSEVVSGAEDAARWLELVELRPKQYFDPVTISALTLPFWPIAAYLMVSEYYRYYLEGPAAAAAIGLVLPLGIVYRVAKFRREMQEDRLAGRTNSGWLGPLMQAIDGPNRHKRAAARRMLPIVISELSQEQVDAIEEVWKTDLIYTLRLNRPTDSDLNAAIIRVLERAGDEPALAAIEYAAESSGWRPRQRFVKKVAMRALERMRQKPLRVSSAASNARAADDRVSEQAPIWLTAHRPEVDELKQRLKTEQAGRSAPGLRRPFMWAGWLTILPGTFLLAAQSFAGRQYGPALLYAFMFALVTQLPRYALSAKQAEAARSLAAFNNVSGVGPLAEALEWPDPEIQNAAAKSLTRLLPLLNASDASLLTGV